MESTGTKFEVLTLLFLIVVSVQGDFLEPLQPDISLRTLTESHTRLPCHYKTKTGERVVQVIWNKEEPDGTKDPIITAHFTEGQRAFGRYSGRVKFESDNPIENSALFILNTQESDEGSYTCHVSTFPSGNFERIIRLAVWTLPISSLDPVILEDGQMYGVVATCRAVGRPVPRLSWDTDLPGQVQNRTNAAGAVSTLFSLRPLRSMNGKKLDCLVWHPALEEPRRISHRLVIQYPPDPVISSPSTQWYVGLEEAQLVCEGKGLPQPQIVWRRSGEPLPDGVSVVGEKLIFHRAVRMNDSGVYVCEARNAIGAGTTEYELTITERNSRIGGGTQGDNSLLIIIGAVAGVVVMVLVITVLLVRRRLRKENKALQTELKGTKEELIASKHDLNTFSRQSSIRRLNSTNSDPRILDGDFPMVSMNRVTRSSLTSLPHSIYKDSQYFQAVRTGPMEEEAWDELEHPGVYGINSDIQLSVNQGAKLKREEELAQVGDTYNVKHIVSLPHGVYRNNQTNQAVRTGPMEVLRDEYGRPVVSGMDLNIQSSVIQTDKLERGDEKMKRVEEFVESTMKHSSASLPHALYRNNQSNRAVRTGLVREEEPDQSGRSVIRNKDRQSIQRQEFEMEEEEETKLEESNMKHSSASLDSGLPSSLTPLKSQQDDCSGLRELDLGHLQEVDSPPGNGLISTHPVEEGYEDDDGGSSSSHQIRLLTKIFMEKKGKLWPKAVNNDVLMSPTSKFV